MALQQLRHLDRSSSKFHDQLSNVLDSEVYRKSVPDLGGNELALLVDYLNEVCRSISFPRSLLDPV